MRNLLLALGSAALLASCSTGADSKEAENMKRTQEFYDQVFNEHNLALVDSFTHPDFKANFPPWYPAGIEGLKAALADQFAGFPDLKVTTNFKIASGDTVVVGYTMTGTNTGSMMPGMEPTGKSISVSGVDIVIIKDGKAVEVMSYMEEMKMMTQLGLMPEMGPPSDSMGIMPADTVTHQ